MGVALFGGMRIPAGSEDESIPLTRKTRLVLAALCLAEEHGVSRSMLAGWIWPDRSEMQARSSLRQALSAIRKSQSVVLPGFELRTDQETVCLVGPSQEIDFRYFRDLVASTTPKAMATAASLYGGDLLLGVEMPDVMETVVSQIRRQCHQQALTLAESLSKARELAPSEIRACAELANRLLTSEAAAEEAHRALIRIRLAAGQVNAAREQFETCRAMVQRTLGAEPEEQTQALIDGIARGGDRDARRTEVQPVEKAEINHAEVLSRPAVLFLPFESLSKSPDDALLALGLCEDIRTHLSSWRSFPVIGPEALGGTTGEIRELASSVQASYVVTGSVRRFGNHARVVARLIDANTGRELWSQTFDGELEDIFEFQDEISRRIVSQVEPEISQATAMKITVTRPKDLTTWELMVKVVDAERRGGEGYGTPEANDEQKMFAREAIERNPNHCEAWARLARCYFRDYLMGWTTDAKAAIEKSLAASSRAVEIDPGNSIAQAFRAQSVLFGTNDPEGAFDHSAEAVRLNPSNVMGHYMMGCTLVFCGEPEKAFDHYESVLRLNPAFSGKGALYCDQMMCRALTNRFDDAISYARKTLDIAPNYVRGLQRCASVLAHADMLDDAKSLLERIDELGSSFDESYLRQTYPFVKSADLEFLIDGLRKAGWRGAP